MNRLRKYWWAILGVLIGVSLVVAQSQEQGRVGPQFGGDGTTPVVRLTRSSAQCLAQVQGKYAEAVLRGNVWMAAVTPGTGVAPGTAIGTTAAISLYNPLGSGKNLRVMRTTLGYTSGTLGAGMVTYAINNNNSATAPTGGTAVTPVNALVGSGGIPVAKFNFGSTLNASPTAVEVLTSMFAELATTANGFQQVVDDVDGRYIITPGNAISLEGVAAAGTSPLISASFMWEEVVQGQE